MTPEAVIMESMFRVVNKDGEDVDFVLNRTQRTLDDNLTGRDLIPKARQEGVSTFFLGRYTAKCLMHRNIKAVIISHEAEATQRLLSRCQYFLQNLRGPAPVIGRDSLNAITFPKMNSMVYIGTAGSRKFGRGDTITHLHCSEYAYWPDPMRLMTGLLQAVPTTSGEVAIESTGNGVGNDYHRRVIRAEEGHSRYKCHFFNWLDFDEYELELAEEDELAFDEELRELKARIDEEEDEKKKRILDPWEEIHLRYELGLSLRQLAWRRLKLEELDYDLRSFKQEYPTTLDECFQASGDSIFYHVNYSPTEAWKKVDPHTHILEPHPIQGYIYVVGADPAAGVGKDNSAIEIFCVDTGEQVGEYAYNRLDPDIFGNKVAELAAHFNGAYIVVESNNHGPITLKAIRDGGYPDELIYYSESAGATAGIDDKTLMKMGFRTSTRTKPVMIGGLRSGLASNLLIHSTLLRDELSTFIEHENGQLAAQQGCKDDRVLAAACAVMGFERAGLYARVEDKKDLDAKKRAADPFLFDNILKEMKKRGFGSPISDQTWPH